MNILFLTPSTANPVTGGISVVCYYLYIYFKNNGHNVTMLAGHKDVEPLNKDFYFLPNGDKSLLTIANRDFLDEIVKRKGIQIVFNHTSLNPIWSVVIKYLKLKGLKIVSVYHSSPYGIYGIKKYPTLCRLKDHTLKVSIDRIIRFLFWIKYHRLINMQARYSDKVVMLSEKFIHEYMFFVRKKYIYKIMAIPNPLTIEELPREKKDNLVLFVGRLSREKGLPYLLRIWQLIEKRYPDWKLQIVGDGVERTNAERMARHLNLQRCTFYGRQKPEDFYNKAKIFCMTSLFEGFGLVLTEAMHYGVVPLAFNSYANVGDIIDDKVNGFIISPFDIEEYASKISILIQNESLRSQMAKAAIRKSEEYALPKIVAKWENLFNAIIKEVSNCFVKSID